MNPEISGNAQSIGSPCTHMGHGIWEKAKVGRIEQILLIGVPVVRGSDSDRNGRAGAQR